MNTEVLNSQVGHRNVAVHQKGRRNQQPPPVQAERRKARMDACAATPPTCRSDACCHVCSNLS